MAGLYGSELRLIAIAEVDRAGDAGWLYLLQFHHASGGVEMLSPEDLRRVAQALSFVDGVDEAFFRDFQQAAELVRIPAGQDIFVEGDRVQGIALLISGSVRVYKIGETGREITLYRFGNGESCILTANAILSQSTFPAIATVETRAEAVMIDAGTFREWVRRYDRWRDFVFQLLSHRLATVMAIVEEVAFRRMDTRLAALLVRRSGSLATVQMTHQQIAAELGSSREVISRLLEDLAAEGLVETGRGTVAIKNEEALRRLAVL